MEMESSRRPAPQQTGLKRARFADDSNAAASRDPRLGGGSQRLRPAPVPPEPEAAPAPRSVSDRELLAQYKTAIAELTINSKPIITNLTIIAGESQHAAKGIASIICNNILEVPPDQKLPSLYLLDSIVKNIGKDYVKVFAAKLPEVFCKAYKQVDASLHHGMKHLFGTWKDVFPSAPLQLIEKELGFSPVTNGSSGTTSKSGTQTTQRPSTSIHVNPKYLERQRLQQSSKAKDTVNDDASGVIPNVDEADRYDRPASATSSRQWPELPTNVSSLQRPRKEQLIDPPYEKKGYRDVRDEFSPELPRRSLDRRVSEKEADALDKPYYGTGGSTSDILASRRNDSDVDRSYGTYRPSGPTHTDHQLPLFHLNDTNKSSRPLSRIWKNSDEHYMQDDLSSRLSDYGGAKSTVKSGWNNDDADKTASLQRGKWMPEHLDSQWNNSESFSRYRTIPGGEERLPLFRDIDELPRPHVKQELDPRIKTETTPDLFNLGRTASGHHASFAWPSREPQPSMVGLNHMNARVLGQSESQIIPRGSGFTTSSLQRPSPVTHNTPGGGPLPGTIGIFGPPRQQQPLQPPSPSAQSPPSYVPLPHQRFPNSFELDHLQSNSFPQMGQSPVQLPGRLNQGQVSMPRESFPSLSRHIPQLQTSVNSLPSEQIQTSSTSLTQMRHHIPFTPPPQPDLVLHTQPQFPSIQTEKQPPSLAPHQAQGFPGTSPSSHPIPGQSSTSDILAAIMKSGLFPTNAPNNLQIPNGQPPLPSGPPPSQVVVSSAPAVSPLLSFPTLHSKDPALVAPPARAHMPPLPPGPPPASYFVSTTSQISNAASAELNPLSNLLSSLVSRGIISSPATEAQLVTSAKMSDPKSSFPDSTLAPVPSTSEIPTAVPSSLKEIDIPEPSAPTTEMELDNLIGFDFKPEILRIFHAAVVKALYDELRHQCDLCGLRFKLEDHLRVHLDWHALNSGEKNLESASRRWFVDRGGYLRGNLIPPCGALSELCLEGLIPGEVKPDEPMVPADEKQCICAFCGVPFEDFYSDERDEWMYKGTLYLNSVQAGSINKEENAGLGLIVHAKCMPNSVDQMEVTVK